MAGPVAGSVRLPDDSGNSGKRIRSQTRVVGPDTVHEHFIVPVRQAQILGVYRRAMAQQTVLAAAQNGTTTGFLWAHVPTAVVGKKARIRRIYGSSQHGSALATPTAPRLSATTFTFTGTASGAQIVGGKVDSGYPSHVLDLRTASTGLTVTLVQPVGTVGVTGALTAVGAYAPIDLDVFDPANNEDEWQILAPGEGIVLYQDTAGTASDTRVINPVIVWDEIDVA